jgi:hypothetical protein
MRLQHSLTAAVLAAALGTLIVPALAQAPGGWQAMPDRGMDMGSTKHGRMSGGMMGGGCAGMMQSMNGGAGRPNSQWQKHPPADRSMPD